MMFSVAIWSLGYGLELLAPDLGGKLIWAKVEFFGISSVAVFLFSFSAAYTGRNKLLKVRNHILLGAIPVITILLSWANQYQYLFWKNPRIEHVGT